MDEVAGAEPGRERCPGEPPEIRPLALRFIDRAGRNKDPAKCGNRHRGKPAERRLPPLQLDQIRFARQRQLGQRLPIGHLLGPQRREQTAVGGSRSFAAAMIRGSAAIKLLSRSPGSRVSSASLNSLSTARASFCAGNSRRNWGQSRFLSARSKVLAAFRRADRRRLAASFHKQRITQFVYVVESPANSPKSALNLC